jgi:hypothetical protein
VRPPRGKERPPRHPPTRAGRPGRAPALPHNRHLPRPWLRRRRARRRTATRALPTCSGSSCRPRSTSSRVRGPCGARAMRRAAPCGAPRRRAAGRARASPGASRRPAAAARASLRSPPLHLPPGSLEMAFEDLRGKRVRPRGAPCERPPHARVQRRQSEPARAAPAVPAPILRPPTPPLYPPARPHRDGAPPRGHRRAAHHAAAGGHEHAMQGGAPGPRQGARSVVWAGPVPLDRTAPRPHARATGFPSARRPSAARVRRRA